MVKPTALTVGFVASLEGKLLEITADPMYGQDMAIGTPKTIAGVGKAKAIVATVKKTVKPASVQNRPLDAHTFHNIDMSDDYKPTPDTEIIVRSSTLPSPISHRSHLISSGIMYQPKYQKIVMWSI